MDAIATARTVAALRAHIRAWRGEGLRVALVPTMGALHDGHLSLARAARASADRVVVSIFVNPGQFAPHEDFDRYPRDLDGDRAKLAETGAVDVIYAPETVEMYPPSFATQISVGGPALGLESDFRPHFFAGVATVVAKLLLQCRPNAALFGEKDYQQLLVVRRLARDLDLETEIVGVPIVREESGLAMSSRNAYLTPAECEIAASLYSTLRESAARARAGGEIPEVEAWAAAALLGAGFDRVDYVAIRDAENLQPLRAADRPARILAAAWLGKTRLIDNLAV